MQQVVGVQTPLLSVKATSVAVCCGCAFTQIILWRQQLLLYVVAVHSPRSYCEGNICDRGCEFTHTLLWRQHPWPYFAGVPFWVTHTPLWRQHRWLYTVVVHLPILSLKLFSLAMCGQTWHHECVYRVNVCLCKHFHVGLQQRKKENKWIQKTGVVRNSAPIFLSLAIALSVTHSHTQMCVHTLTVKWGGAVTLHTSIWNLQLVTHWKTPPTHTHTPRDRRLPFDPNPATLTSLIYTTSQQVHWSFISLYLCVCVGGRGGPVTSSGQVLHLQCPCVKAKLHWSQMGYFLTTLVIWRKASIVSLNIILPSIIGSWIWKELIVADQLWCLGLPKRVNFFYFPLLFETSSDAKDHNSWTCRTYKVFITCCLVVPLPYFRLHLEYTYIDTKQSACIKKPHIYLNSY